MKRFLPAALLLPLCVTCAPLPAPGAPSPATIARLIGDNIGVLDSVTLVMRFPAPPIYAMWRAEVEACSGRTRVEDVTVWVAQRPMLNASGAIGMYIAASRRIVLGLGYETVAWTVRHEYLHHLLNLPPTVDAHPPEYFRGRCGALVYPPGMYP